MPLRADTVYVGTDFHRCTEICTCPACGRPLIYAHGIDKHACSDSGCANAHGIDYADVLVFHLRHSSESLHPRVDRAPDPESRARDPLSDDPWYDC